MRPQSLRTDAPFVISRSETVLNEKECVQQRIKSRDLWVMQFSTTEEFKSLGRWSRYHTRSSKTAASFPQSVYTLAAASFEENQTAIG